MLPVASSARSLHIAASFTCVVHALVSTRCLAISSMSLHLLTLSSNSYISKSKVTAWLAEVSPRDRLPDRLRLKRARSDPPPPPPRIQTRHQAGSTCSACEIGRSDMAELPKTPTPSVPSANPSKRARIDVC